MNALEIGNRKSEIGNFRKPMIQFVPFDHARRVLHLGGFLIQEKSDGIHRVLESAAGIFNSERMADGSHVVNDLIALHGEDARRMTTAERWGICASFYQSLARCGARLARRFQSLAEVSDYIRTENGEGAVLKPISGGFGEGWIKLKRSQNFFVRVSADSGSKQSVPIELMFHMEHPATAADFSRFPLSAFRFSPAGHVALFGGKSDRVRPGSILKLTAYGLTAKGCLREPRPDADPANPDSWLVQY